MLIRRAEFVFDCRCWGHLACCLAVSVCHSALAMICCCCRLFVCLYVWLRVVVCPSAHLFDCMSACGYLCLSVSVFFCLLDGPLNISTCFPSSMLGGPFVCFLSYLSIDCCMCVGMSVSSVCMSL